MRFYAQHFWGTLAIASLLLFSGAVLTHPTPVLAQQPAPSTPAPSAPAPATAQPGTQGQQTAAPNDPPKEQKNLFSAIQDFLTGVALAPVIAVTFLILTINSWILSVVGGLFNFAVVKLVFQFSIFFGNSAGLLIGWSILRDLGNIILLFGFVFIGIQTILNVGHFSVGKALPRLIIFALLLNFSLFAAEAIIDASNAFASVLYTEASASNCAVGTACSINGGIASSILDVAGIGTIFQVSGSVGDTVSGILDYFSDPVGKVIGYLGITIFVTTAWVVLLAGAVLLISRAVVLAIVMMTSPIGFAGMAIPALNEFANTWWKALINNALFAPVYLILVFVSLKVMTAVAVLAGGGGARPSLADVFTKSGADKVGGILVFALLIGFMIAALMAAKKFGVYGAETIIGRATKLGGASTAGVAGFFGRRTIGAASNAGSRAIARTAFGRTDLGRFVAGAVGAGANKSFDARGSGLLGKNLGSAGKTAQKGIAGIIHSEEEKRTKWDKESKKIQKVEYEEAEQRMGYYQRRKIEMNKKADEAERAGNPSKAATFRNKAARFEQAEHKYHDKAENTEHGKRTAAKKKIENENLKPAQTEKRAVDGAAQNIKREIAKLTVEIKGLAVGSKERTTREETIVKKTREYNDLAAQSKGLADKIKEFTAEIQEHEMKYAESLERTAELLRFLPLSVGKRALRGAAIEIRETIKKSNDAKLLDMIKDAGKKDGGDAGHAPTPPPVAGPAPAPH